LVFIYNVCSKCGRRIKVKKPRDQRLAEALQKSNLAVCRKCDPGSFWIPELPDGYFLSLLNLRTPTYFFRKRAPAGSPKFWEGKAKKRYICSECQKNIEKGEMYIGVKRLATFYSGLFRWRSYRILRAHVSCLLKKEEAKIEGEIERLKIAINKAERHIVYLQKKLASKRKKLELHQFKFEKLKKDYTDALDKHIKNVYLKVEQTKKERRPKLYELILIIPAIAKVINYSRQIKSLMREFEQLERERKNVSNAMPIFAESDAQNIPNELNAYRRALSLVDNAISLTKEEIVNIEGEIQTLDVQLNGFKKELNAFMERLKNIRDGMEELKLLQR